MIYCSSGTNSRVSARSFAFHPTPAALRTGSGQAAATEPSMAPSDTCSSPQAPAVPDRPRRRDAIARMPAPLAGGSRCLWETGRARAKPDASQFGARSHAYSSATWKLCISRKRGCVFALGGGGRMLLGCTAPPGICKAVSAASILDLSNGRLVKQDPFAACLGMQG